MARSVLAAVGLLVALSGLGLFVALGYSVWPVRRETDRTLADAHAKAELAADTAAHTLALVREVIDRAGHDLAAARAEAALHPQKENVNPLVRMVVREQARNLPDKVEQARDAVGTASDAVVVASAALNVFSQLASDQAAIGVTSGQVHEARNRLDQVAAELRQARSVLGVPVPRGDTPATAEQLTAVDDALTRARAITDELERVLNQVRAQVAEVRAQAELWVWRGAVGITALSSLAALGQAFMARACWRALRRKEW
jgi:hypothetical protein